MDKSQAEAAAEALMGPGLRRHEEVRKRRAAALARKQHVTKFVVAGCALGAGAGYLGGIGFLLGMNLGGLTGLAAGWFVTRPKRNSAQG